MNQQEKEQAIWAQIAEDLRSVGSVGAYGFESYISKLRLLRDTGTKLILEYPQDIVFDWFEINYHDQIVNAAARVLNAARTIEYVAAGSDSPAETHEQPAAITAPCPAEASEKKAGTGKRRTRRSSSPINSGLNADYTFDGYVVGSNNEFAYAAAQAIVNNCDCKYNPLFVHGDSGLGKTHLLQAIGNAIQAKNEGTQVLYVTSEDFTNAYIEAISKKGDTLNAFRRKYRKADVLLIDDVQFMARAGKTQEEFFHTFNALFESGKQIILSADCPASNITNLESRLTTRFEQGLTVSLQAPDYETRMAILRQKLRRQWKSDLLSNEVLEFLAKNVTHSIRALEGALVRMTSYASFARRTITVADARIQLKDLLRQQRGSKVSVSEIQQRVADEFNIRLADINGRRRTAAIAHPRQVAMYLARKHTDTSLQDIGAAFGGRDHGTVLHASRTIEQKMKDDSELRAVVARLAAAFV
ncbi:MAG: chromosomal replication initiator protein DnaA [Akkermansiaceae bacterium]|nr:chromosomal replication initiator protein DnaA [Akkermansiaceae bacterium]